MKLKNGFITHESDGEQIMVSAGNMSFSGLVRSNKTAAFIVEKLKCDITETEIVSAMLEKYDVSKEIAETDVKKIVEKLRSIEAIDE